MSGRGGRQNNGRGGRGNGGRGGHGRGRGQGYSGANSALTKGLCAALGNNVFDYGHKHKHVKSIIKPIPCLMDVHLLENGVSFLFFLKSNFLDDLGECA